MSYTITLTSYSHPAVFKAAKNLVNYISNEYNTTNKKETIELIEKLYNIKIEVIDTSALQVEVVNKYTMTFEDEEAFAWFLLRW